MSNHLDVQLFHKKFDLPLGDVDKLTTDEEAIAYRVKFLQEELDELQEALAAGDRVKAFDALLDLVYVAHGTALWMGIDVLQWGAGWMAVQQANMAKERATSAEQSKRGSAFDVVKPEGWQPPEKTLEEILSWLK